MVGLVLNQCWISFQYFWSCLYFCLVCGLVAYLWVSSSHSKHIHSVFYGISCSCELPRTPCLIPLPPLHISISFGPICPKYFLNIHCVFIYQKNSFTSSKFLFILQFPSTSPFAISSHMRASTMKLFEHFTLTHRFPWTPWGLCEDTV